MKARLRVPKQLKNSMVQEAKVMVMKEKEKQNNDMTRRIIKLFCYALNEHYQFGGKRLSELIYYVGELIKESDTDEIFWEHIDRNLIDRIGLNLERDYTDEL